VGSHSVWNFIPATRLASRASRRLLDFLENLLTPDLDECHVWKVLRPAISKQVFPVLLCREANAEMRLHAPSCCFIFLIQRPQFKFFQIISPSLNTSKWYFWSMHFYHYPTHNSAAACTVCTITFHHLFFIFMLLLSEGQAGKPGDILTKWCSPPPPPPVRIKVRLTDCFTFPFLCSYIISNSSYVCLLFQIRVVFLATPMFTFFVVWGVSRRSP
jgi:hypothetical protein